MNASTARAGGPADRAAEGRRVAVIGAGVAGLATAALLARDGYEVDVFERGSTTGGRAGSWSADGFRFDTGPSWYLLPEVFDHFFALCGTTTDAELDLVTLDPGYRVFADGFDGHVELSADVEANIATFEAIETGAGERLRAYLASAADARVLAIRRFLYSTFASFRPLLTRDVLLNAGRLLPLLTRSLERHVARSFTDRRLQQILGYPAVFLGSSPGRAPALYHLMSSLDLADGVRYPRGGFTTLVAALERLATRAGARIHLDHEVTLVETERTHGGAGADARVRGLLVRGPDGAERHRAADVVVAAGDLHHTETTLVPRHLQTYPERYWRRRDAGPGAVLVLLGVRGRLPELAHHTLSFTADWDANFDAIFGDRKAVPDPASLYVCAPSRTDPTVAPPDHENLFVLVPVPADPTIGRGGTDGGGDERVERAADLAIDRIAAATGVSDLRERIVVRRTIGPGDFADDLHAWRGGALGPGHTLRQSAWFRGSNASARIDGLLYAGGTTIPGVGLPMCLISAELVRKRLHGDTSTEPTPVAP